LTNEAKWFKDEALELKKNLDKKKEISNEIRKENFALGEDKRALE